MDLPCVLALFGCADEKNKKNIVTEKKTSQNTGTHPSISARQKSQLKMWRFLSRFLFCLCAALLVLHLAFATESETVSKEVISPQMDALENKNKTNVCVQNASKHTTLAKTSSLEAMADGWWIEIYETNHMNRETAEPTRLSVVKTTSIEAVEGNEAAIKMHDWLGRPTVETASSFFSVWRWWRGFWFSLPSWLGSSQPRLHTLWQLLKSSLKKALFFNWLALVVACVPSYLAYTCRRPLLLSFLDRAVRFEIRLLTPVFAFLCVLQLGHTLLTLIPK